MAQISFTEDYQAALIGHAFKDARRWEQLDTLKVDENWFSSARLTELWPHLLAFRSYNKRPASPTEVLVFAKAKDPESGPALERTIQWCCKAAEGFASDALDIQLVAWAQFRAMQNRAKEIVRLTQSGDHTGAVEQWRSGSLELDRLAAFRNGADQLEGAAKRVKLERAERLEQAPRMLKYGITYLDDSLYGISPNDLIVLGGRSGAGKSECGKIIAAHNAAAGHTVDYFSLESEKYEIERRIKFTVLTKLFLDANPQFASLGKEVLSYSQWRMGQLESSLGEFEDQADEIVIAKVKNLRTYYRTNGDFDINTLERRILEVKSSSRLIVIDHLHYVDLEEEQDEHRAMKAVVKKCRDLVLGTGIPMILIAHLRKNSMGLVPNMEDFHGSSDIFKIATVAATLAPANGYGCIDPRAAGYPTFLRVVKCRMDQRPLHYVGVNYFSKRLGDYLPDYGLGKLNFAQNKWTACGEVPDWATHGTLTITPNDKD